MTDNELLQSATKEGFRAALTTPDQIPVNPEFRSYCQQNLCGQYNASYSCPPDCGTPEELHQKMLAENKAIVLQTLWDIKGYDDIDAIIEAKNAHTAASLRLLKTLRQNGYSAFCISSSGCTLCTPCKRLENQPCAYPEWKTSCMSAYCIDVAKLAENVNLPFAWETDKLYLFGMIVFH